MAAFEAFGFVAVRLGERFDCFAGTSKERTARKYEVAGVNLSATKPHQKD